MPERRRARPLELVLSCEHAVPTIPARHRALFRSAGAVLSSHRGFDPGADAVARALGKALHREVIRARFGRLLVEPNRSLHHPRLFSEWTRALDEHERARLVARYWAPHRERVTAAIEGAIQGGPVLHLGIHSFTPVLDGIARDVDLGLLYDPARSFERRVALDLKHALVEALPGVRVRSNRPYLGRSDGLTTALRRRFPEARYAGIELELSQGVVARPGPERRRWIAAIARVLEERVVEHAQRRRAR